MSNATGEGSPREPVIEVEDLVTHYGTKVILNGINLTVYRGEIMVIMGSSGSGKSTLLRHLLGLKKSSSGTVRVLGKDISQINNKELYALRKQMGVAFQGGALLGSLSVGDNVCLPLREHTRLDESTIQIMSRMKLEMMRLGGAEDLMPSQLSGGMLKRAGLARAIVMDPKMLFFDEPSSGLDPVTSAELDELILLLRQAMSMTIVVVTHELESAFNIADRITVIDAGQLIMTGTVEEVRQSEDEHIQKLINRKPSAGVVDAHEYLQRLTGFRP